MIYQKSLIYMEKNRILNKPKIAILIQRTKKGETREK